MNDADEKASERNQQRNPRAGQETAPSSATSWAPRAEDFLDLSREEATFGAQERAGWDRGGTRALTRRWRNLATSVGIVLLVAVVVGAGSCWTVPQRSPETAHAVAQDLPVGQSALVCPSKPRLLSAGDTEEAHFAPENPEDQSTVSALVGTGKKGELPVSHLSSLEAAGPRESVSISHSGGDSASSVGYIAGQKAADVTVLRVDPVNGQSIPAAGTYMYSSERGDLQGIAAAACQSPAHEGWFLGMSTEVGHTALLHLVNPMASAATVSLDFFGPQGPLVAKAAHNILLPPGSTKRIVLAGLVPNQHNIAAHYTTTGSAVTAFVQFAVLRGLNPGGVAYMQSASAPSKYQVVTGAYTAKAEAVQRLTGRQQYADAQSVVEILSTSTSGDTVRVEVLGPHGKVPLPQGGVVNVQGKGTAEIPLSGLPEGTYTVELTAQHDIVASARTVRGSKNADQTELAFVPATSGLAEQQLIARPQGTTSHLVLGAPKGSVDVSLAPVDAEGHIGEERRLQVGGGTTAVFDPPGEDASVGYRLSVPQGSQLYGAQVVTSKDFTSTVPLLAQIHHQRSLSIGLAY